MSTDQAFKLLWVALVCLGTLGLASHAERLKTQGEIKDWGMLGVAGLVCLYVTPLVCITRIVWWLCVGS